MVWGPLPKIRRCWWILNCYNSKGLVFPEMLKGSIYIWRAGTFLHISCCLRIYFFISLNLHFLKFDKNFTFFSNFLNFFFDFSFYVIVQKCCLQQSWAWHKKALPMTLALDSSMKAYREKGFFTEPYIFRHDSCKWKLT